MKNLLTILPLLACAGIIVWKILDDRRLGEATAALEQRVAALETENSGLRASARQVAKSTGREPAAKPAVAATGGSGGVDSPDKKKPKSNAFAAFGDMLQEMMKDDGAKEMMKQMQQGGVEGMYKDLFDLLALDEPTRKALLDALAEQQQQGQARGLKLLGASGMNKEEKDALLRQVKEDHAASEEKIRGILGDGDKYKQYQRFQDSAPERQTLAWLKGSLQSKNAPLNEQQEQQVMDTLYAERKATPWEYNYSDQHDLNPEKFTDQAIQRYQEQAAEYDNRVAQKLQGVLNEDQVSAFKSQRTQSRAMEKMGLNMAKALFGE